MQLSRKLGLRVQKITLLHIKEIMKVQAHTVANDSSFLILFINKKIT